MIFGGDSANGKVTKLFSLSVISNYDVKLFWVRICTLFLSILIINVSIM